MRYLGPVSFMVIALAVLLATAGVIPWASVLRAIVSVAAIIVIWVGALTVRMIRLKTRRPVPSGPAPKYLLATAASHIDNGDLVRVDLMNSTVTRVDRLPNTVEGPIQ